MEPQDQQHDQQQGSDRPEDRDRQQGADPPHDGGRPAGEGEAGGAQVIATDAPLIARGPAVETDWASQPDRNMVVQTNRIREPNQAFSPNFVMVPVETERPERGKSGRGEGGEHVDEDKPEKGDRGNGRKGQADRQGHDPKARSDSRGDRDEDRDSSRDRDDDRKESGHRHADRKGQPAQASSWSWKSLLITGAVALVCGVVGAWGYSALFGSDKSKDGSGSGGSSKDSGSGGDSGSSGGSDSSKGSGSGGSSKDSDTRKNSTSNDKNPGASKLLEAQAAWLAAVKELRQVKDSEKNAHDAEERKEAILNFLRSTLLSAGRPGGGSLSAAFWSAGEGKDVSLRTALDRTESQVSEAFKDRPLAEASVREMLGLAYLNVGEPKLAVHQYERALALREATEGPNNPETAQCRNQLAVVYRVAGNTTEAAHLFDRDPNSSAHAAALAARGAMLILQKKPADAEIPLRECLAIRRKIQRDDWRTFDTESMLGQALLDQKKYDEAEPYLLSGYEGLRQHEATIPADEKPHVTKALERLVQLYESRGDQDKATQWRKELRVAEATNQPDRVP